MAQKRRRFPHLRELPAIPDHHIRCVHLAVERTVIEKPDAIREREDRATPHAHIDARDGCCECAVAEATLDGGHGGALRAPRPPADGAVRAPSTGVMPCVNNRFS
jgi:hypothetical protein